MTKKEVDKKLKDIENSLKPCPLCEEKACIIRMHSTLDNVVIDSVGCLKCNLTCERESHILIEPIKILSRTKKVVVDAVQTWNNRPTN